MTRWVKMSVLLGCMICLSACIAKMDSELFVETTGEPQEFIIRGSKVFDGFEFRTDIDVWVRGEQIIATGKEMAVADDVTIIDGSGKSLLPGLIDPHVHLVAAGAPPWRTTIGDIDRTLSANLASGVTSVVDMGAPLDDIATWENDTSIEMPRVAYAGRMHSVEDGHPAYMIEQSVPWPLSWFVKNVTISEVEDIDDVKESIDEHIEEGAQFIKVAIDEIPLGTPKIDLDLLTSLVDYTHQNGLRVAAHIGSEEELLRGVSAGVDIFAHGPYRSSMSPETIDKLKASGAPVIMTAVVFDQLTKFWVDDRNYSELERLLMDPDVYEAYQDRPEDLDLDEATIAWFNQVLEHHKIKFANLRAMHDHGVPVFVGSDSPNVNTVGGAAMHVELALWQQEAGLDPESILRSATGQPGQWLEEYLGWKVGRIKPGYSADLLLVDGDIEEDVRVSSQIDSIWIKGKAVSRLLDKLDEVE